jgi:predicted amidophosphoribosyltransferase
MPKAAVVAECKACKAPYQYMNGIIIRNYCVEEFESEIYLCEKCIAKISSLVKTFSTGPYRNLISVFSASLKD